MIWYPLQCCVTHDAIGAETLNLGAVLNPLGIQWLFNNFIEVDQWSKMCDDSLLKQL